MEIIYHQLFCLIIFVITGIAIGILFDFFRILRKSFKTSNFITYLQDILFWILAGGIMLFSIFTFNNGEIRVFIFVGILLGIILYMITISKILIKYSVIIINFIKKIFSYPINLVMKFIKHFIIAPVISLLKKSKNLYIKLQNTTKNNMKNRRKHKKSKEKEGILEKM